MTHFPTGWYTVGATTFTSMADSLNTKSGSSRYYLLATLFLLIVTEMLSLQKKFGLGNVPTYVFPGGGGFPVKALAAYRQTMPSKRRKILIKGYHHWSGRSHFALRAVELAAESLCGHEIVLYSASPDVILKARLTEESTGLRVTILPPRSQIEMMRTQGQARVSLGLSISDGLPNTFLEAMVMGAFPIQSFTSCANEWVIRPEILISVESAVLQLPKQSPKNPPSAKALSAQQTC